MTLQEQRNIGQQPRPPDLPLTVAVPAVELFPSAGRTASGTGPPPGPQALAAPQPACPREPASILGRLILAVVLLSAGLLGLVDLAGAHIPASAYFAVPLAVVGTGLLVGAWFGRARALIALGAVLSVPVLIAGFVETWNLSDAGGNVTWQPTSIEQLTESYSLNIGNGVLDLSNLDFTGRSEQVDARVDVGNLTIILPSDVDATVTAQVDVGSATVLGRNWNGLGQSEQTVIDAGPDGSGGGELLITASVDVGDLEVRR